MEELLTEIDAFLALHNMTERDFGLQALKDHKLVPELRGDLVRSKSGEPRSPSLRTVDRVREFMRDYQPETQQAAA